MDIRVFGSVKGTKFCVNQPFMVFAALPPSIKNLNAAFEGDDTGDTGRFNFQANLDAHANNCGHFQEAGSLLLSKLVAQ